MKGPLSKFKFSFNENEGNLKPKSIKTIDFNEFIAKNGTLQINKCQPRKIHETETHKLRRLIVVVVCQKKSEKIRKDEKSDFCFQYPIRFKIANRHKSLEDIEFQTYFD